MRAPSLVAAACLTCCLGCASERVPPVDHGVIALAVGDQFHGERIGRLETGPRLEVGYYANGRLAFQREITDGRTDGVTRAWYPSGRLKYERRFATGQMSGRSRSFDEDGRLVSDEAWFAGVRIDCHDAADRAEPSLDAESQP
jgi:hypothetical protein